MTPQLHNIVSHITCMMMAHLKNLQIQKFLVRWDEGFDQFNVLKTPRHSDRVTLYV